VKFLIDMNLTPAWVEFFTAHGFESIHWQSVGAHEADDAVIMSFAREHDFILFTHDLDFGCILAVTQALGPSVVQARVEDPLPDRIGDALVSVLQEQALHLERGALVTLDPERARTRVLPIVPGLKT
jgi:predicted nuclease of predicted toxin-antitoxin system